MVFFLNKLLFAWCKRCNFELPCLWVVLQYLQRNPPELICVMCWACISRLLTCHPWWGCTPVCRLTSVDLAPGLGSVSCAPWHLCPSIPQGWGGWTQLPRDCRASWSPNSKTCLAGGSNVDSVVVAVTLAIKREWCSWFEKCSRKQKGQLQRCFFSLTKRQHVKKPKLADYC